MSLSGRGSIDARSIGRTKTRKAVACRSVRPSAEACQNLSLCRVILQTCRTCLSSGRFEGLQSIVTPPDSGSKQTEALHSYEEEFADEDEQPAGRADVSSLTSRWCRMAIYPAIWPFLRSSCLCVQSEPEGSAAASCASEAEDVSDGPTSKPNTPEPSSDERSSEDVSAPVIILHAF